MQNGLPISIGIHLNVSNKHLKCNNNNVIIIIYML